MAKTPFDLDIFRAYPEKNPNATKLWEKYDVDPSEIENYAYYGFGEKDVEDRLQENYKRYGMNPHSYNGFEEAMLDLIADVEQAHPDLYEKKWGRPHPVIENGEEIEEDYLKDLAKVRAKHRGGDLNLAEKELRGFYGDLVIPKQSRTLGDIQEEKQKQVRQDKYNKKVLGK